MLKEKFSESEVGDIAEKLYQYMQPKRDKATVVGLSGDLGAGKTTLTKELGKILGVAEEIQSPTFVIAKFYKTNHDDFAELIHIDAYRIEEISELKPIGWESIINRPNTLVVIEWPERISTALPQDIIRFSIWHEGDMREISYESR